MEVVLKNLKCSKCKLCLSIPPITCANNDFLCGRCSTHLTKNRLWCYEKLATLYTFPCKYRENGCIITLKFNAIGKHEEICDWCKVKCPFCEVLFLENSIPSHMTTDHNSEFLNTFVIPISIKEVGTIKQKLLTVATDFIYLVKITNSETITITVSYFGKKINRHSSKYTAKLYSDQEMTFPNKNIDRFGFETNQISISPIASSYLTGGNSNPIIWLELKFSSDLEEVQSDFLQLMECSVCFNFMSEVGQCEIGHSFCKNCIANLPFCPICKKTLSSTSTNYLAENLSKLLKFPCKNQNYGCFYTASLGAREIHEKNCYVCPSKSNDCKMAGVLSDVIEHCRLHHSVFEGPVENALCSLKLNKIERLFCIRNNIFVYCREFRKNHLYWTVLYFGPAENADLYQYTVSIVSNNERSWKFTEKCLSYSIDYGFIDSYFKIPIIGLKSFIEGGKLFCSINIDQINDVVLDTCKKNLI